MNVTVTSLAPDPRGRLYAQLRIDTPDGPIMLDHVFVRRSSAGYVRPEMPQRPHGGLWVPIIHLPQSLYMKVAAAIEAAMQP